MAAVMDYLVLHRDRVHYRQVRPMLTRPLHTLVDLHAALASPRGVVMDCSEAVTLICKLGGLTDPNGLHYNGSGYTGTLLRLPHYYDPHSAMLGALVVFGGGTGHHVTMVREPGADPLLWSHGQESDPRLILLSLERQHQPSPVTFLSIAAL
jgi:hypothetical protein